MKCPCDFYRCHTPGHECPYAFPMADTLKPAGSPVPNNEFDQWAVDIDDWENLRGYLQRSGPVVSTAAILIHMEGIKSLRARWREAREARVSAAIQPQLDG